MADKRIDQLTAATTMGDDDLLVLQQNNQAKKLSGATLSDYIYDVVEVSNTEPAESRNKVWIKPSSEDLELAEMSDVDELKTAIGYNTPTLTRIANKYINVVGNILNANGFSYTEPVAVKKGDYVTLSAAGYEQNVAMISTCLSDGTIVSVCSISIDDAVRDYTYLVTEDGFLCFCFMHTKSYGVKIVNHALATDSINAFRLSADGTNTDIIQFEIGNITISTSGWNYNGSTTRIRTPQGVTLHCYVGDVLKLSSYSNARFIVGWKRANDTYGATDWITKDYTVAEEGDYVILITAVPEATVTDVNDLAELFNYSVFRPVNLIYEYIDKNINFAKPLITWLGSQLLVPSAPRFAMHRGYSSIAPENTIPSFTLAGQAGAWGIETDIYETTDGVFVCAHDDDVTEFTDGTGKITEKTYAQIQQLTIDAGNNIEQYPNEKIPKLEDFLKICRRYGCIPLLDMKAITNYANFVDVVKAYGMINSCIFATNGELAVIEIRKYTNAPIAFNVYSSSEQQSAMTTIKKYINGWLSVAHQAIDQTYINLAHENNIPIMSWTVDNTATAETLIGYGVDAIISNNTAKLE